MINLWTCNAPFTIKEALVSSQKVFSKRVDDYFAEQLFKTTENERDKARLNSVSMPHAGDLLNAITVKAICLHLKPPEFTSSVKYCLA